MFYLFNNIKRKKILDDITNNNFDEAKALLTDFAIVHKLTGNIWKKYILYVLIYNDNSYTRYIERNDQMNTELDLASSDIKQFYDLYNQRFASLSGIYDFKLTNGLSSNTTKLIDSLYAIVEKTNNFISFKEAVIHFYTSYGIGDMAVYKAFRVDNGVLSPIHNVLEVTFNDIIGYEEQKKMLIENTEFFIHNKPYNNVLLYGDSGTGKSTSIKALLYTYYPQGLRIIEVYKHQMEEISKIIHTLKNRPYFYVIYMDDLSFEEDEVEYKYLKSIIEGGIEPKPNNVVIYATSNRRHLIKETFMDNQTDDLHRNETQAEKLSLAYRFGLQIYYSSLSPMEFRKMVKELATKNDLKIEDNDLIKEASKWELTYGSLSGRCATQFISYLANKYNKK